VEAHGGSHWAPFYTDYGVRLQKRFFDYFLKGMANGWDKQPRVQLQVRHLEKNSSCATRRWPLARTMWTHFHLDPKDMRLSAAPFARTLHRYDAMGRRPDFSTRRRARNRDHRAFALKLFISSSKADATSSRCCACSTRREGNLFQGRARSENAWVRDGCAHRRESSIPCARCLPPSTRTTRSGP